MRGCLILTVVVFVAANLASSESLKPSTAAAFDLYVKLSEQRMENEQSSGLFLWAEGLASPQRSAVFERLKQGEVVTQKLETLDHGIPILTPGGLVHHWVGIVFIPGTTLKQTLELLQNYDEQSQIYAPHVVKSCLLRHQGDDFKVFLQLREQNVITVVLDSEYEIHYFQLNTTRAGSRSYSTRVVEVENAGQSNEREKSADDDSGYLWRLNSYWHFWERDGGVYVQLEAISLTRDIPEGLGWLIRPFITSIPEESLRFTLSHTQSALKAKPSASSHH